MVTYRQVFEAVFLDQSKKGLAKVLYPEYKKDEFSTVTSKTGKFYIAHDLAIRTRNKVTRENRASKTAELGVQGEIKIRYSAEDSYKVTEDCVIRIGDTDYSLSIDYDARGSRAIFMEAVILKLDEQKEIVPKPT